MFLFLGFFELLVSGTSGVLVSLAIYSGILADLEGLIISIVLKKSDQMSPPFRML